MSGPAASSDRSSESSAFDSVRFGSVLDWTKHSLLLNGNTVAIVSAEFHYFRVPDRERWRPIMADIKGMGFNAVRLYIHWGYHSPAEGVYNFRGNRDILLLLDICTDLELFVILAPGPYICAEVQAGGFPIWLVAKRELRIRHLAFPPIGFVKKWDVAFHEYCAHYLRKIISMTLPYERTTNPNGCIIALQIENELREPPIIGFGGIDDEIRLLCEVSREAGSTLPFFHNDDAPIGSWSTGSDYRSLKRGGGKTGVKAYRTDLYGFDLYFTFPPNDRSGDLSSLQLGMVEACGISACLNGCGIGGTGIGGSDTPYTSCLYEKSTRHAPPPPLGWANANQMEVAVDCLERQMDKFGGSAKHGPPIAAETQVGWINQWGRMRNYDDVYNFFGDRFSSTLQLSLMAQGITFINHYTAYGGTNHGTVGDTEVYSSYDYSAFIREYGLLSGRGRYLRMAILFARSFADLGFANSATTRGKSCRKSETANTIKSTVPKALIAVREAVLLNDGSVETQSRNSKPRTYAYLRNLKEDKLRFNLIVNNIVIPCYVGKCGSYVVPLYHTLEKNLSIFACTVPVVCRAKYEGSELWVLQVREAEVGRLVLNVNGNRQTGRQGVNVKWAIMDQKNTNADSSCGEMQATDQDQGAATSWLSGPLEELPLSEQNSFASRGSPLGVRASTEEIGLCFSFSFSVSKSCVVAIRDLSEEGSLNPILRLLCLTEKDAGTFTADLNGNDAFKEYSPKKRFTAAWGVSNLAILPSGILDVGFSTQDSNSTLFLIQDGNPGVLPEQFHSGPSNVMSLLPGLAMHKVAEKALKVALSQGVESGNPLSKRFEVKIDKWSKRAVHWSDDVTWKRISYDNRDPLDHFMTSGHVAYRLRFWSGSRRGSLVVNARHSAVIWCNGKIVGEQICFSHNLVSAGAMHAVDIAHAGKKRHDLTEALHHGPNATGVHEVIILVLSMGQSRSPFLLNDIRNKRGLLSARLSYSVHASNVCWDIAGVDVTRTDDAYGSSGLPLEDKANNVMFESAFVATPGIEVKADAGVVFYRGSFKVPANCVVGGMVRYPLRIKVMSGAKVRAMLWVNTLFLGRFVEQLGPQTDFYVPEGLIKQCKGNSLVVAVYGSVDTNLSLQILPWVVDAASGNLNEQNGEVFALRVASFALGGMK